MSELSLSGEALQTFGEKESGAAGKLNSPRLCMVDGDENMLIADRDNKGLQVRERSGQLSVLDLQPPVNRPTGAVIIDNKLYVSSSCGIYKLLLYTID